MTQFIFFLIGALLASIGPLHNLYVDNIIAHMLNLMNIHPNMSWIHLGEGLISFLGYVLLLITSWEKAFTGKTMFLRSITFGLIPTLSLAPYFEPDLLSFFFGFFLIVGGVSLAGEYLQEQWGGSKD